MKKETPKRLTSALCSCAINKKLSTPYDFYVCDVISKERVKRIHLCSSCRLRKTRKGGITFVPSVSGINEITFLFGANLFADQSLPKKGKKMIIYSMRILNGLLFGFGSLSSDGNVIIHKNILC